VEDFNNARTQYEENQGHYNTFLANEANRLKVELVAANDRLEDQYFRRMIWKMLFVISFGINVGLWIGGAL
jgi:hypothetical protein